VGAVSSASIFWQTARTCSSLACAFITTSMCLPRTISLAFAAELGKQRAADVRKDARANECFRPRVGWVIYNRCFQSFTFYWQGHSLALDENIYEIRREN